MTGTKLPLPEILQDLHQLAVRILSGARSLSQLLDVLNADQVKLVTDSAESIMEELKPALSHDTPGELNPIETKKCRHDIRNQLAVIRGFTDLMLMECPEDHAVCSTLEDLMDCSDKMVEDLEQVCNKSPEGPQDPFAS